mmetsp:Transcript_21466/g.26298  ORF Transcript_21466/g.26298 Transcript_21466/m.26298 type:complete len:85 (-) Transcript_21466:2490-2744(-)
MIFYLSRGIPQESNNPPIYTIGNHFALLKRYAHAELASHLQVDRGVIDHLEHFDHIPNHDQYPSANNCLRLCTRSNISWLFSIR